MAMKAFVVGLAVLAVVCSAHTTSGHKRHAVGNKSLMPHKVHGNSLLGNFEETVNRRKDSVITDECLTDVYVVVDISGSISADATLPPKVRAAVKLVFKAAMLRGATVRMIAFGSNTVAYEPAARRTHGFREFVEPSATEAQAEAFAEQRAEAAAAYIANLLSRSRGATQMHTAFNMLQPMIEERVRGLLPTKRRQAVFLLTDGEPTTQCFRGIFRQEDEAGKLVTRVTRSNLPPGCNYYFNRYTSFEQIFFFQQSGTANRQARIPIPRPKMVTVVFGRGATQEVYTKLTPAQEKVGQQFPLSEIFKKVARARSINAVNLDEESLMTQLAYIGCRKEAVWGQIFFHNARAETLGYDEDVDTVPTLVTEWAKLDGFCTEANPLVVHVVGLASKRNSGGSANMDLSIKRAKNGACLMSEELTKVGCEHYQLKLAAYGDEKAVREVGDMEEDEKYDRKVLFFVSTDSFEGAADMVGTETLNHKQVKAAKSCSMRANYVHSSRL